jgi:nucleobase:cation symporter-1, NCS1 family
VGEGFKQIYTYAWFIGLAIAAVVYGLGMARQAAALRAADDAPQA